LPPLEKIKRAAERTRIKKRRTAIMTHEKIRNAITNLVMVSPVSNSKIHRHLLFQRCVFDGYSAEEATKIAGSFRIKKGS
jgi:hypothetical protein